MIGTVAFLLLLGTQHWVFDWVLQSRRMGNNKSHSWKALADHIKVVTFGLVLTWAIWDGATYGWADKAPAHAATLVLWVGSNTALHFVTDAITSRISSRSFKAGREYAGLTTIGADQWMLHYPALILTSALLLGVPTW